MLLDEASVTGTANIIMASVLAEGTTTIYNAACEPYLQQLCKLLNNMGARISGVGSNLLTIDDLFNCAFVMTDGEVMGVVPKVNLPNTGEFYEKRWFTSGRATREFTPGGIAPRIPKIELWSGEVPFGTDLLFCTRNYAFGIEICEDLWSPLPPSTQLAIQGAEVIFNLSSSNCIIGKHIFRKQMIKQQSARVHCGYVYTSSGVGESTTDVVTGGCLLSVFVFLPYN